MKPIEEKPSIKVATKLQIASGILQVITSILQIACSCVMVFYGTRKLADMAIYALSDTCINYYSHWSFAINFSGVSFAVVLFLLRVKFFGQVNTRKSTRISLLTIFLNSVFILLWIGNVADNYHRPTLRLILIDCLPLIPLIVIIILASISLLLRRLDKRHANANT